ncbi:MAG: NRDE family protein, partial [Janthinobacterium lividum]
MCLIVLAWKVLPDTSLLAAANRDEFYARAALPAHWWQDRSGVYAGRDLEGGGTWLGISRSGHFAALTNVRAPADYRADAPTRGSLASDFLAGSISATAYAAQLAAAADPYNGYNLLVADGQDLVWYSNAQGAADDARNGRPLAAGIYGLSNAGLDTPWPKVVRTKAQFSSLLCQGASSAACFDMLGDTSRAATRHLPDTGVGLARERLLSAVLIESP